MAGSSTHTVIVGEGSGRLASANTTELLRRLSRVHPQLVFRRDGIADGSSLVPFATALRRREIDLTVRPLKDMPTDLPPGIAVGAVLARADARDALCGSSLRALPHQARVGAGSLRRAAQLLALRPDVRPVRLQGPMTTQLRQLLRLPRLDAVVLPIAALARLGLEGAINEPLAIDEFPPAPGQGALGVLTRAGDTEVHELLATVHDLPTAAAFEAEQSLRAELHESCGYPIGAHARVDHDRVHLIGQVTALDGSRCARQQTQGPLTDAPAVARQLAADLYALGAGQILTDIDRRRP